MNRLYYAISLCLLCIIAQPALAASSAVKLEKQTNILSSANSVSAEEWNEMSRKEKREIRKSLKKEIKRSIKTAEKSAGDTELLLLVIIAVLLPPLAMALYDGITNRFWLSLLLTLLFYVPGLIYTLVIILGWK